MAVKLPPIPNNPITDVFVWRDWFYKVSQALIQQASTNFVDLNFDGSNLQSIETRQHNALQSIQGGMGGQYYHLSASQYASVNSLITPAYGSFYDTTTQTAGAINTPQKVSINTSQYASQMSISSSRVTFARAGLYNIAFSFQVTNTDVNPHDVDVWLRQNGTDVTASASVATAVATHAGQPGYLIIAANFFIQAAVNDYLEMWWATNSTTMQIQTLPAITTPFASPAAPGIQLTINQVA